MKWWRPLLGAIALVALCQWSASAQQPDRNNSSAQQKIESLKADYLDQQLKLSPDQAQRFWPLYRQYQQQMAALARQRRQNQLSRNQLNHPSDAQVDQSLDRDFKLQQQALQLREQYRQKFRQVIPSEKVMQFYKSEKDFNMKLVRELRRRGTDGETPSQTRQNGRGSFERSQPSRQNNQQQPTPSHAPQRAQPKAPSRAPVRSEPARNNRGSAEGRSRSRAEVRR
jgi:hypothetical protein